jgi:hypothetical protein
VPQKHPWVVATLTLLILAGLPSSIPAQAPPAPSLQVSLADPGPRQSLVVTLAGLEPFLGSERLQNGGFSNTLDPWRTGTELGASATMTHDAQGLQGRSHVLRLTATAAPKAGSLYARQDIAFDPSKTYLLTYSAVAAQAFKANVEFILRERTSAGAQKDTFIRHELTTQWTDYSWTFTPQLTNSSTLMVFPRIKLDVGGSVIAGFDDVSLKTAPKNSWAAPGATILKDEGHRITLSYAEPGQFEITATGTSGSEQSYTSSTTLNIANHAPLANLRLAEGTAYPNRPVVLDASTTQDPDGTQLLLDSTFNQLGSTWRTEFKEVAPQASFATKAFDTNIGGHLQLRISGSTKAGTVYASQTVALSDNKTLHLTTFARDGGNITRYELILREAGPNSTKADTTFTFPPTDGSWRLLDATFKPKLPDPTQLTVYLRARLDANASDVLSFSQPRLLRGLNFSWQVDGQPYNANGAVIRPIFSDVGPHTATVTITDEWGAQSSASLSFHTRTPSIRWQTDIPTLVPIGLPIRLSADHTTTDIGPNLLRNADFSQPTGTAWTLGSKEIGGNASYTILSQGTNRYAHVEGTANKTGTLHISQEVTRPCPDTPCQFQLRYRTKDNQTALALILRERLNPPEGSATNRDHTIKLPASTGWTHHLQTIPQNNATTDRFTVYLRFTITNGTSSWVEFDDVVLRPQPDLRWTLESQIRRLDAQGPRLTFTAQDAGIYNGRLRFVHPVGAADKLPFNITVLPLRIQPRLDAGLVLAWTNDSLEPWPGLEIQLADGSTNLGHLLVDTDETNVRRTKANGQQYAAISAEAFRTYTNLSLRISHNGTLSTVPIKTALAPSWQASHLATPTGPRIRLDHTVRFDDPTIESVTLHITHANQTKASLKLERRGGAFVGTQTLPIGFPAGTYNVTYEARDLFGTTSTATNPQPLIIQPTTTITNAVIVILATLGAGLALLALNAWRRRQDPGGRNRGA